jgi:YfiH family protein
VSAGELRFELPSRGTALFTARAEGNMSSATGDGAEKGEQARERLLMAIGAQRLARARQVHGASVQVVERVAPGSAGAQEADGQATALTGVAATVLVADCLPVALGTEGAVAMVHAGWRGLAGGVIEAGVARLRELAGDGPIAAVIGPGAGVCCYEVGAEVHRAFGDACRQGLRIDLRAIAHERLLAAGVGDVQDVAACTICDERFFSHRREGARAGRQAGVAWLS